MTLDELLSLNGLSESDFLQPGDELLIRPLGVQTVPEQEQTGTPYPATFTPVAVAVGETPTIRATAVSQLSETPQSTPAATEIASSVQVTPEIEAASNGIANIWLVAGGGAILIFLGIAFLFANRRL